MTTGLALTMGLMLAFIALFYGLILFPRWFAQSMLRHALWRLRDALADDVLANRLPHDHQGVSRTLYIIDSAVRGPMPQMLDYRAARRAVQQIPERVASELLRRPTTSGLTDEQRTSFEKYLDHFEFLSMSMFLLGSWYGVATTARFAVRAAIRAGRAEHKLPALRPTVRDGAVAAIASRGLEGKLAVKAVH